MSRPRLWMAACAAAYLLMLGLLFWLLWTARQHAIASLENPQARADWQKWRAEVERENRLGGPVRRRSPGSHDPPALILLRDHFGAVVGTCFVVSSALFSFLAIVGRGVVSQSSARATSRWRR